MIFSKKLEKLKILNMEFSVHVLQQVIFAVFPN